MRIGLALAAGAATDVIGGVLGNAHDADHSSASTQTSLPTFRLTFDL
jgi:hypothetical protein